MYFVNQVLDLAFCFFTRKSVSNLLKYIQVGRKCDMIFSNNSVVIQDCRSGVAVLMLQGSSFDRQEMKEIEAAGEG